jgi:hypothetical protein
MTGPNSLSWAIGLLIATVGASDIGSPRLNPQSQGTSLGGSLEGPASRPSRV